jgi:hypothetical protein
MPIFDQGYQHWQGPLSGHAWRWLTIARHGVRVQMKNRLLRMLLLSAWLPALGLVAAVALWGLVERKSEGVLGLAGALFPADVLTEPRAYRSMVWTLAYSFFFKAEMFFIMLLVAIAGPRLISQDLRFNALPLYLARPLTRLDYFLGKLGVIGALVAAVAVLPAAFAYLVGLVFCFDLSVIKDTYTLLLASVAYGLVVALSAGTLVLALSSLSRRSLYVGIAWAGLWIISGSVATMLTEINHGIMLQERVETEMAAWLAEHPPPAGIQMHRSQPVLQFKPGARRPHLAGTRPGQEVEAERWYDAWSQEFQLVWVKARDGQGEALKRDWRPLCSYVANLERIADRLLDTDAAWVTMGRAVERSQAVLGAFGMRGGPRHQPANERRIADQMVAQYPWAWSAGVLAGLLGLSVWILTLRVKSLDRLR